MLFTVSFDISLSDAITTITAPLFVLSSARLRHSSSFENTLKGIPGDSGDRTLIYLIKCSVPGIKKNGGQGRI